MSSSPLRTPLNRAAVGEGNVALMNISGQIVGTPLRTNTPNLGGPRPYLPTQRKLIRPILPSERTYLDRLIDAIVGDGPNNRYALICKNCASHNGMAIREEIEYLAFRCVYCGFPNPSRKPRPRIQFSLDYPHPSSPPKIQDADEDKSTANFNKTISEDNEQSGVEITEVTDIPTDINKKEEVTHRKTLNTEEVNNSEVITEEVNSEKVETEEELKKTQ